MTTIAWDGKTLAGDTQTLLFRGRTVKVHRLKYGGLLGLSGGVHECFRVKQWLDQEGDKPTVGDTFHAIVIRSGRLLVMEEGLVEVPYQAKFFAVGSGREFAMAAMRLGSTAADAVRVAHEFDVHTGPDVVCVEEELPEQP